MRINHQVQAPYHSRTVHPSRFSVLSSCSRSGSGVADSATSDRNEGWIFCDPVRPWAELHGVAAGLRTEFRTELHEVRDALRSDIRELRQDIRIGVQESQNLARGLHAEAMAAVAALDTSIRHDLGAKLDQILALHEDERPT